jgi:hypothetical protein
MIGLNRLRLLIHENLIPVVLSLVCLGVVLAGVSAYNYTYPTVTETIEEQNTEVIQTTMETEADVITGTIFSLSEDTIKNSSLYLTESTPEAQIHVTSTAPETTELLKHESYLVIQGYPRDSLKDEEAAPFWEERFLILSDQRPNDSEIASTGIINANVIYSMLRDAQRDIGGEARFSADLVVTTTYETSRYEGEFTEVIPVKVTAKTYQIGSGSQQITEERSTPTTIEETTPREYQVPIIISLLLFTVAGSLWVKQDSLTTGLDPWEVLLSDYDSWVSNGKIENESYTQTIYISSLPDLVDTAMDSRSRVIYDSEQEECFTLVDQTLYYTTRPPRPPQSNEDRL